MYAEIRGLLEIMSIIPTELIRGTERLVATPRLSPGDIHVVVGVLSKPDRTIHS